MGIRNNHLTSRMTPFSAFGSVFLGGSILPLGTKTSKPADYKGVGAGSSHFRNGSLDVITRGATLLLSLIPGPIAMVERARLLIQSTLHPIRQNCIPVRICFSTAITKSSLSYFTGPLGRPLLDDGHVVRPVISMGMSPWLHCFCCETSTSIGNHAVHNVLMLGKALCKSMDGGSG